MQRAQCGAVWQRDRNELSMHMHKGPTDVDAPEIYVTCLQWFLRSWKGHYLGLAEKQQVQPRTNN